MKYIFGHLDWLYDKFGIASGIAFWLEIVFIAWIIKSLIF